MADDKSLKPKSFRITDETADKFKEIAGTIGGNQQEALAKLIEAYEFQQGKAVLTEKKADLEKFEQYVAVLVRMYMGSLEDNQNITDTVRTEFEALLKSKDAVIQDLQSQLTTAKQLREQSAAKAKEYADQNSQLNDDIRNLRDEYEEKTANLQKMLDDKSSLNRVLTDSCEELKGRLSAVESAEKELDAVKESLKQTMSELDEEKSERKTAEKDLQAEKKGHEQELAHVKELAKVDLDRALLDAERTHQAAMQELKDQKQAEVDKYQQKYFELIEKFEANRAAMQELKDQKQKEIEQYQQKYLDLLERSKTE